MRINNYTDFRGHSPPPSENPRGHPKSECSCFGNSTVDCETVITENTFPQIEAEISALEKMQGTPDAQRAAAVGAQLAGIQNKLGEGFEQSPYYALQRRYIVLQEKV